MTNVETDAPLRRTGQEAFRDFSTPAALLYHVEKACGILEDRPTKARLSNDASALKLLANGYSSAQSWGNEDASAADEQESVGFVHDRRFDPSTDAPNTVAEVVVEMLVSASGVPQLPCRAALTSDLSALPASRL